MTDDSLILIDTSFWSPKWLNTANGKRQYINENNLLIGIKEESFLLSEEETPEEMCSGRPCEYQNKWPACAFLSAYRRHLDKIDFNGYLIPEFERIAEDVRKITHYKGEPKIVLLVHEKPDNPCSERGPLIELFRKNGIILQEWTREDAECI